MKLRRRPHEFLISLHDPEGNELAFADDYRFDPDPVLFYKIPRDGEYRFEMPQPIPSYLLAIAVGDLEFRPIGERAGVYAEPSLVEAAEDGSDDDLRLV